MLDNFAGLSEPVGSTNILPITSENHTRAEDLADSVDSNIHTAAPALSTTTSGSSDSNDRCAMSAESVDDAATIAATATTNITTAINPKTSTTDASSISLISSSSSDNYLPPLTLSPIANLSISSGALPLTNRNTDPNNDDVDTHNTSSQTPPLTPTRKGSLKRCHYSPGQEAGVPTSGFGSSPALNHSSCHKPQPLPTEDSPTKLADASKRRSLLLSQTSQECSRRVNHAKSVARHKKSKSLQLQQLAKEKIDEKLRLADIRRQEINQSKANIAANLSSTFSRQMNSYKSGATKVSSAVLSASSTSSVSTSADTPSPSPVHDYHEMFDDSRRLSSCSEISVGSIASSNVVSPSLDSTDKFPAVVIAASPAISGDQVVAARAILMNYRRYKLKSKIDDLLVKEPWLFHWKSHPNVLFNDLKVDMSFETLASRMDSPVVINCLKDIMESLHLEIGLSYGRQAKIILTALLMDHHKTVLDVDDSLHAPIGHLGRLFCMLFQDPFDVKVRIDFRRAFIDFVAILDGWKAQDALQSAPVVLYQVTNTAIMLNSMRVSIRSKKIDEELGNKHIKELQELRNSYYNLLIKIVGRRSAKRMIDHELGKRKFIYDLEKHMSRSANSSKMVEPSEDGGNSNDSLNVGPTVKEVQHNYLRSASYQLLIDKNFSYARINSREEKYDPSVTQNQFNINLKQIKSIITKYEYAEGSSQIDWVPDVIRYIHSMVELVIPQHQAKADFNSKIDLEYINQQCLYNSYDPNGLLEYCLSVMKRDCAPVRDDAIDELSKREDRFSVSFLHEMLDILDNMRIDMSDVCFRLGGSKYSSISNSHELSFFLEDLYSGAVDMDVLNSWVQQVSAKADPGRSSSSPSGLDYRMSLIRERFGEFMCSFPSNEPVPETLKQTKLTVVRVKISIKDAVLGFALMQLVLNMLGRKAGTVNKTRLKSVILEELQDDVNKDPNSLAKDICSAILNFVWDTVDSGFMTEGQTVFERLVDRIITGPSSEGAVSVALNRVKTAIQAKLSQQTHSVAFNSFEKELEVICDMTANIWKVTSKTYEPIYMTLLKDRKIWDV